MFKFYFDRDNKQNWAVILNNCIAQIKENRDEEETCVEIKRHRKQPSDKQRAYLFGIIYQHILKALKELGNDDYRTVDDIHLFMKYQLNYYELSKIKLSNNRNETSIKFMTISNDGDKQETKEYIDACIRWANEKLEIEIPRPEEIGY